LKNKTVIITGGASGIGKSICEHYAKLGWTILILDIDEECGMALKSELSVISDAHFYYCDFSNLKSTKNAGNLIRSNHPTIDCIIHNARAPNNSKNIAANLSNEISRDFNVLIHSPLLLSELLIENLSNGRDPCVTFIGSTNSSFVSHQPLSYHICKGALIQAVRFLAASWGARNIRVNLLNPGIVEVPNRPKKNLELFTKAIKASIPLGRAASTSDISSACIFLSSDNAQYMTGSTINLDGGGNLLDHFHIAYKLIEKSENSQ